MMNETLYLYLKRSHVHLAKCSFVCRCGMSVVTAAKEIAVKVDFSFSTTTMSLSGSSPLTSAPLTPSKLIAGYSFRRRFRPYFTKRQLGTLASLKGSGSFSSSKELATRNSSCKFIQQVCNKIGL